MKGSRAEKETLFRAARLQTWELTPLGSEVRTVSEHVNRMEEGGNTVQFNLGELGCWLSGLINVFSKHGRKDFQEIPLRTMSIPYCVAY